MFENKISDSEFEIMEIMWARDDWMSIHDIMANISKKWKYTTVATFAERLKSKEILESKKTGQSNLYRPLLSKDDYITDSTKSFVKSLHKGSVKSLFASLYNDKVTENDLNELTTWIEELKTND